MGSIVALNDDSATLATASAAALEARVGLAANENAHLPNRGYSQSGLGLDWIPGHDLHPSAAFNSWHGAAKRILDVVAALAAIVFLAPLLLFVALAVKLESRGPVFFRQQRDGKNNVSFEMMKFRSMYMDKADLSGVRQTTADDPRVTLIGRFLRKTSIDELPQLFNVLKGDMSLVGPRPHVAKMLAGGVEYRELVTYYDLRHLVRPGLTGWAQANGLRGPTTNAPLARRRVDHDLAYVQNFSFWLDLKIIFLTIKREIFSSQAM
jgi:exopolysaccharide biosynthesis polyprenyl glycosylphosphotransferase